MHGYKWPINCTRTRTESDAVSDAALTAVTIAISANLVDSSNFRQHLRELQWQAIAESDTGPGSVFPLTND
eukprot:COSAG02_NODE_30063_length_558_cov_0.562092_1_plen_71_part_00